MKIASGIKKDLSIFVIFILILAFFACGSGGNGVTGSATYTVTFNSMGGDAVAPKTVKSGATVEAPANPFHEPEDYYILGAWCKDAALNNEWNFSTDKVTDNITLYAKWKPTKEVGDSGPEGGTIVYVEDDGFEMTDTGETAYYLESAPGPLTANPFIWAMEGANTAWIGGLGEEIGTGRKNTKILVDTYIAGAFRQDAAKQAASYPIEWSDPGTTPEVTDYFLPSIDELQQLYITGVPYALGPGKEYWSSSEDNDDHAWLMDDDATPKSQDKGTTKYVWPIRAF